MAAKKQSTRVASGGKAQALLVKGANNWRETYNPLRGLSVARAVALRDSFLRGELSEIEWVYRNIEMADADMFALVQRRVASLMSMDWDIRTVSDTRTGWDEALAQEQAAVLRAAYERLDNLYEAIEHLALASFRGFAHLEKHVDETGGVGHLEVLDQWNVVRAGIHGGWKINPKAQASGFTSLPEENLLNPEDWIIREVPRHINWIGLIKYVLSNLAQKDWAAFVEFFGIPGAVVIGPPDIPDGKESEYEATARAIAEGGSGYVPNGTQVVWADSMRGVSPFRDHLRYWQEQLILAGTGGLLTMLAESGSGTLAGGAHSDTWQKIAEGEARQIGEVLQHQFDQPLLDAEFPGKPRLAYWALAATKETDPTDLVAMAVQLSQAGFEMDAEELSEKIGFTLTRKSQGGSKELGVGSQEGEAARDKSAGEEGGSKELGAGSQKVKNRVEVSAGVEGFQTAVRSDLEPVFERLNRILGIKDAGILKVKLNELLAELPGLVTDINRDPASARVLEAAMAKAMAKGAK